MDLYERLGQCHAEKAFLSFSLSLTPIQPPRSSRSGMTCLFEFRQHVNSEILQKIGISPHSTDHILACLSKSCSVQESLNVSCAKGTPMTPDGFYIDTPTPHDVKTPETLFERNPTSFMGAEDFKRDRDHLGSPSVHAPNRWPPRPPIFQTRQLYTAHCLSPLLHIFQTRRIGEIKLVGSELMFEDIETNAKNLQQDHIPIVYSPQPLGGPPPLRGRFKVQQCAFNSFQQASPKDSPAVPGGLTRFKYISFPPNPCIVYRNAIKRRDNWLQPPLDPAQQTGRAALVPLGSARSIYNATIEHGPLRRTASLPVFRTASLDCLGKETVMALSDVVHKQHDGKAQWAVRSDCPSDCPYSGYCSFAGIVCPKVSPSHDGTPCPRLSQIKAMCRRLSRPKSAPKARNPRPPNCTLRRVVSNCTLEEMERGECCQVGDPSSSQDGSHSDGSDADDDDVLNLSHLSNHDSARVLEDCPRPLAPSDVEMLCKPIQALTPTSRNVGLGFGWGGSASSSTSTASELSASLSSLLAVGRAAEAVKRGLESARESLSDETSLPAAEEVEEDEDDEEDEEEEKKQGDLAVVPLPLLVPPPAALLLPVHQQQDGHREQQEANNPSQCVKYCKCRNCRRSRWCTLS